MGCPILSEVECQLEINFFFARAKRILENINEISRIYKGIYKFRKA